MGRAVTSPLGQLSPGMEGEKQSVNKSDGAGSNTLSRTSARRSPRGLTSQPCTNVSEHDGLVVVYQNEKGAPKDQCHEPQANKSLWIVCSCDGAGPVNV